MPKDEVKLTVRVSKELDLELRGCLHARYIRGERPYTINGSVAEALRLWLRQESTDQRAIRPPESMPTDLI